MDDNIDVAGLYKIGLAADKIRSACVRYNTDYTPTALIYLTFRELAVSCEQEKIRQYASELKEFAIFLADQAIEFNTIMQNLKR
jgi:hypothetical protein